jgi:polyhydroxybutyrate depolymerase
MALSACLASADVAAEPIGVNTIAVGARQRLFAVDGPASPGPHPTIFILHGANGTVRELSELPALARAAGVVTVIPQGIGGRWNFFLPGRESDVDKTFFGRLGGLPDDEAFLRAVAADLVARRIADPRRMFMVGLSLGGVMALRMVCADATLFSGMAFLIAGMEESTGATCRPAKPLPVLMVRGTADRTIPDAGGLTVRGDRVWPTSQLVGLFRQLNGCAAVAANSVAAQSSPRIEIESSANCPGGPVVLYRVIGGGHEVPATLMINSLILDFFRLRHAAPLPPAVVGPAPLAGTSRPVIPAPSPLPSITVGPAAR